MLIDFLKFLSVKVFIVIKIKFTYAKLKEFCLWLVFLHQPAFIDATTAINTCHCRQFYILPLVRIPFTN